MRGISVAAASLVVLALTGCGSAGERDQAASGAAVRMLTAVDGKDGAAACAVLAPDTVSKLEETAGKPCPQAILDEDLPKPGPVTGTDVYGQWAQVRLSDDTLFLGVFPDGWRVVGGGGHAGGGRSSPYHSTRG